MIGTGFCMNNGQRSEKVDQHGSEYCQRRGTDKTDEVVGNSDES
jgi:hypothetical protein